MQRMIQEKETEKKSIFEENHWLERRADREKIRSRNVEQEFKEKKLDILVQNLEENSGMVLGTNKFGPLLPMLVQWSSIRCTSSCSCWCSLPKYIWPIFM